MPGITYGPTTRRLARTHAICQQCDYSSDSTFGATHSEVTTSAAQHAIEHHNHDVTQVRTFEESVTMTVTP